MKLTKYHPSIRRLQEDFAARIARRKYIAARGPRPPKGKITDNSEPWLANPNSVSDDCHIACKVNERVKNSPYPSPRVRRCGRSSKAASYLDNHSAAEFAARVPVAKQPCMR